MCGRYDLSENPAAIKAKFSVPAVPDFAANPDVRPTQLAPIVRLAAGHDEHERGARECVLARWGLVPVWAKELKFGSRCINARAETLATAPAFRAAYRKRRCLVPVSAFYEWTGPAGHKVKWRVGAKDDPPFALAGLWEWWKDPASGEGVETYTIVTCDANAQLAPIHDRMPVIVAPANYAAWLDPNAEPRDLLVPFADELQLTSG
jgi:putative SOS response-associated peptidase YedK